MAFLTGRDLLYTGTARSRKATRQGDNLKDLQKFSNRRGQGLGDLSGGGGEVWDMGDVGSLKVWEKEIREGWAWKGKMGTDFRGFECQVKVFHKAGGNLGKLLGKGVI